MARGKLAALAATILAAGTLPAADVPTKPGFPKFQVQEIATDLAIGYAVLTADINGDKKPDIVVVDKERVIWYENPTWKMRTIVKGKTKPDNVCAAALDIDGDGQLDLAVGAAWKPADTATPATVQWFKRGASLDDEWTMYPMPCDEPTVHRMRVADTDGDGKVELLMAPLQGRGASAKGNFTDGKPVRVISYPLPKDPTKAENWKPKVISDELYVIHNFMPFTRPGSKLEVLVGSYDGVSTLVQTPEGLKLQKIHAGNQVNPKGNRGASEIKGTLRNGKLTIATVEPWHGNQIVVYTPVGDKAEYQRTVIDEQLRWGHAVWFADLDGDGAEELVIGVRDDPNPKAGDKFAERRGVRIYKAADAAGTKWDRLIIEDGGVAVEDLTVDDLDGDGKPDVIAVGRATGNCRIYWNKGK